MKNIIIIAVVFLTTSVWANFNSDISSTAELRQEVEVLALEIENLKKSQQSEMDVYIQRDQEITAQILKEKFRNEQYRTQIKLGQAKLSQSPRKTGPSDLWIKKFWSQYEASLKTVHPLAAPKLQERIQKLKIDLDQKKISYEHALLQTWFVLESDLTKSQDAEFLLSPLQVGDKLMHVEMVRLGRTKGYFRTAEGQYGKLFYNNKWDYEFFEDSSSQKMIETILTQFKQQQKTGLYQLPGIKL